MDIVLGELHWWAAAGRLSIAEAGARRSTFPRRED